jgi:hypothetical protein
MAILLQKVVLEKITVQTDHPFPLSVIFLLNVCGHRPTLNHNSLCALTKKGNYFGVVNWDFSARWGPLNVLIQLGMLS